MNDEEQKLPEALSRGEGGDAEAVSSVLEGYRTRLRQMVAWRMHRDQVPGVDPAEIVDGGLTAAAEQLKGYLDAPRVPFYVWLRGIVLGHLAARVDAQDGKQRRADVPKSQEGAGGDLPASSLEVLVNLLVNREPGVASLVPLTDETLDRVRTEIGRLSPLDREVLVLCHLEHLDPTEVAHILRCPKSEAKARYIQALKRIHAATTGEGNAE
jgi:DNA-directed RNA polymerase specialized sigma24 family protein